MPDSERRYDEKIAAALGISHEELSQTAWELDTLGRTENYLLVIKFKDTSPQHILEKIKGMTAHTVYLDPDRLG